MKRLMIKELLASSNEISDIVVKGWIRSIRKAKDFCFIVLNDGSSQRDIQIVAASNLDQYDFITKQNTGASLAIQGNLVRSQGQNQAFEIQASKIEVIGSVAEDYPLQKKQTSLEFLRENAHLRARTNTFGAVFRLRHVLAMATHEFFSNKGFYYLNSPILTGVDAEGAGEVFQVTTLPLDKIAPDKEGKIDYSKDYFGKPSYLCVTGQLEAECFASALGSVYTFGPTFRSENSNTSRHLSEFWMIEPEVCFADLADIADLATDYIKHLIKSALDKCPDELQFFNKHYEAGLIDKLTSVLNAPFVHLDYTDAIEILKNAPEKFEYRVSWDDGLQSEHERYLCEKHFKSPVIVKNYPKAIKAFYMKQNEDGKTVRAMDILVPGIGEIIGGSQREEDFDKLKKRMDEIGLKESDYWWYLDLRRFGTTPHAGFGLGFERAIMYISGISNIRDVIAFPRTPKNLDF